MPDTTAQVFIPTNAKGLCGRCGKTRGMHYFTRTDDGVVVYCTPVKKGDKPVAAGFEDDLEALWEPTPHQCSSCGHTTANDGKYLYKITDKYRYCLWCQARGGRGNVTRLILVRNLADRDCENKVQANYTDEDECGKCLPCLARKWSDHPFA